MSSRGRFGRCPGQNCGNQIFLNAGLLKIKTCLGIEIAENKIQEIEDILSPYFSGSFIRSAEMRFSHVRRFRFCTPGRILTNTVLKFLENLSPENTEMHSFLSLSVPGLLFFMKGN
ncbi:MAG: hypothetical protein B6245_09325 [Desulfobacteraceae bacterium 4572_88]|nr:MAG: hypothetical protein B6245_09325 [Desulfobacteraceae bacterium 4572_88]